MDILGWILLGIIIGAMIGALAMGFILNRELFYKKYIQQKRSPGQIKRSKEYLEELEKLNKEMVDAQEALLTLAEKRHEEFLEKTRSYYG